MRKWKNAVGDTAGFENENMYSACGTVVCVIGDYQRLHGGLLREETPQRHVLDTRDPVP